MKPPLMNARAALIYLLAVIVLIPTLAQAELIDKSGITVSGDYNPPYHPSNTLDDDLTTFWHSDNNLQIGQVNELVYRFSERYNITQIDFFNDFTNRYNLGELAIQYMNDTGSWVTFRTIAGDFDTDDFTINPNIGPTTGIRLEMTYQGRGAHGSSPAFYLSEIDFYGALAPKGVSIDIKPGSYPNSINLCSRGVVPAAVLGSDDFDVTQIDPDTLALGTASPRMLGKGDKRSCSIEDVNGDLYDDLICQYNTIDLGALSGETSAIVTGSLFYGTKFEGSDTINIVKDDCPSIERGSRRP